MPLSSNFWFIANLLLVNKSNHKLLQLYASCSWHSLLIFDYVLQKSLPMFLLHSCSQSSYNSRPVKLSSHIRFKSIYSLYMQENEYRRWSFFHSTEFDSFVSKKLNLKYFSCLDFEHPIECCLGPTHTASSLQSARCY